MPPRPGAAAESTALLWSALEATADLVLIVEADGSVVALNDSARRVSEPGASEYPWNIQLIDDAVPTRDMYPLVRAMAERAEVHSEVVTMVHGEPALWNVRAWPIIRDGEVAGAVGVGRDITETLGRSAEATETAAFIRTMLRSSSEAILAVDAKFNLRYSNEAAREMFALLTEGEELPHEPRDILDVDGEPPSSETLPLERALGGETDVHTVMRMGDPLAPFIVEGLANPILGADGRVVGAVGAYRDVTAEHTAEEQARATQAFVRLMLDGLDEGIAAHNVIAGTDFRNASAIRMGVPSPAGDEPLPYTLLDGSPVPQELIFRAMVGDEEPPFEMVHPETGQVLLARTRSITTDDGVLGAVFTTTDITELRGAAERLRIQSAAMEATITAMFITDADGTIEWVNRAFSDISGFSAEEAIGRNPRILKSGQQGPAHYAELWETILRGEPWSGRVINKRKNGDHYVVDQWVTPMRDASGAISHFVAVHDDVTAQVEAEEQVLHMATHDALTNLSNRRLFLEHLEA
ncbi:MAG: PAS domain S-box protein, partial [Acidimicrobiia bacterium]|nr:PAS domain S-box protein [Acidimicrobiia bacterium]